MNGRHDPIPVAKLKTAVAAAEDINLRPETLDLCTAPEPDLEDGLTKDEKVIAISRLDSSGRTASSGGAKVHQLEPESGPKIALRYGWVCQTGFYPEDLNKLNQDSYLVLPELGSRFPEMALFGVFDGHGKDGTECSTFASDRFAKCMVAHKQLKEEPEAAIEDSLLRVNKDMHKAKKKRKGTAAYFDDTLAGTTAINVLFVGDEIIVANVGDSRAVIATMSETGLKAEALSADQTPYRRDERQRCRKAGAVVMTMDQLEGYKPFNPDADEWGDEEDDGGDPPRLWVANKGCPGVAFTRSLGDEMAESIGCIPNPETVRRKLLPTDRFIVIASDGVFEFLSSQTVVDMVSKFSDPHEAAMAIVTESYKLWLHYEVRTDDITCIVIFLEHPDAKKAIGVGSIKSLRALKNSPGGASKFQTFSSLNELNAVAEQQKPVRREMSRRKREMIESSKEGEGEAEAEAAEAAGRTHKESPKSPEQLTQIRNAIKTNFLFQHLNAQQLDEVLKAFRLVAAKAGEAIIKEGDQGTLFYVVGSGEYDCYIKSKPDAASPGAPLPSPGSQTVTLRTQSGVLEHQKKVHTYVATEGGMGNPSFGELALMYSKPRAASVVCRVPGTLWALDRATFRRVLIKRPNKELIATLRMVKIFESLGKSQLQRLADTVSDVAFANGDVIIRQGDVGETMYIIKEGACRVTLNSVVQAALAESKKSSSPAPPRLPDFDPSTSNEVMRVSAGGYFGERALLHREPRAASVIAVGATRCFHISRATFEDVLGPLADIISNHAQRREAEALAVIQMQENLRKLRLGAALAIGDIVSKCEVSATPAFTLHFCCLAGDKERRFSVKSFDRDAIEKAHTEARVQRDRELLPLAAVKEPSSKGALEFAFPVLKTFIGARKLHVALSGVVCGLLNDFMASPFSEPVARFAVANLVLMIEFFHHKRVVLRCINPQMLMVDDKGYVRVADLGSSKYLEDTSTRAYTLCGDTGYIAPEQVLNRGHSYEVDFWALGLLILEMLSGKLPWKSEDPFSEITRYDPKTSIEPAKFPQLSEHALDLVRLLTNPDPAKRLCSTKVLMAHPFLKGVDWSALAMASIESPLQEAAIIAAKELNEAPPKDSAEIDSGPYRGVVPATSWFADF